MPGKVRRILIISSICLISFTFTNLSSAQDEAPAKEKCASGYSFNPSNRECVACNQSCKTGNPGICSRGIWNCDGEVPVCEPAVKPGERMELCNGEDDDCNGTIDDGFDKDSDGYTTCSGDCNDRDPAVHPDAIERCDGADNNCNGMSDDGFNVGGHCTAGQGVCQTSGRLSCKEGAAAAVCDAIPGSPSQEVCDGLDNDCDGKADEDLGEISCGVGACQVKAPACQDGKPAQCTPGEPGREICGDAIDNNCDGKVDEGFAELGRTCYDGVGACKTAGKMICGDSGLALTCSAKPGEPSAEICGNKIDDDCDGDIDTDAPGLGNACTNGLVGACSREGVTVCKGAAGEIACSALSVAPAKEICDGVDNDCNGETDEGVQNQCDGCGELPGKIGEKCRLPGRDECSTGTWVCSSEGKGRARCEFDASMTDGSSCVSDYNPCTIDTCARGGCSHRLASNGVFCDDANSCTRGETCIDGECAGGVMIGCDDVNPCTEDSCDVALGCVHTPIGQGEPNACGGCAALDALPGGECAIEGRTGPCSKGIYTCQPDGLMVCVQSAFGRLEECNGVDDDCDGAIDEDLGNRECGIGACMRQVAACQAGKEAKCVPGDPAPETCSNKDADDDCNGVIDDMPGSGQACAVTIGTCVIRGKQSCLGDAQNLVCVPANPSDAQDADSDGTPNYCEKEGGAGGEPAGDAGSSAVAGLFDSARTRASVLPWREVFDSIVLGADTPGSAMVLVSGATGDKGGFAVLRAKDATKEQFSFATCEASVGERPMLLAAAGKSGSVVASSGAGYIRYHKISSQIPSPDAKDPSCRLFGERLQVPQVREFRSKRGAQSCEVVSIDSIAMLSEAQFSFAGAARCRNRLGASLARVSEALGLDIVVEEEGGGISHEFVPIIPDAGEIEGARITALGQGKRPPIFVAARADGKTSIGICSYAQASGWRCDMTPAPEIDSPVVMAMRTDKGRGEPEVLMIAKDGEAYTARQTTEGGKVSIKTAGRAASATSGGFVEAAVEIGGAPSHGYTAVGQERSISIASTARGGDGRLMLSSQAASRFEPRSIVDDVSPGGRFSFNRPHAMTAIQLKPYGGSDLFAAFDMQKAGRAVGSMGFIYWKANGPPSGGISDVTFDGASGRARYSFTDPTGDRMQYRAWVRARHGGSLDHWMDGMADGVLKFSPKGDASGVGLWPIEITIEARDEGGQSARSKAIVGRDGRVEAITQGVTGP